MLYPKMPAATTLSGKYVYSSQPESMNWWMSAASAVFAADPAGLVAGTLDGAVSGRAFSGSYTLDDRGSLSLVTAPEGEAPTESRFLLASDSFGLGISTGETYVADGCRVIER
jgi:hypothetical protein